MSNSTDWQRTAVLQHIASPLLAKVAYQMKISALRWALDTPLSGLVFPKKNEAILEAASL